MGDGGSHLQGPFPVDQVGGGVEIEGAFPGLKAFVAGQPVEEQVTV